MKMSDVFDLPLQAAVDELAIIDNNDVVVGWVDDFHGELARDYFIESINNHDRLTEENAKLREIIWEIVDDCEEDCYNGLSGVVNSKTVEKINQLKEQTNDK